MCLNTIKTMVVRMRLNRTGIESEYYRALCVYDQSVIRIMRILRLVW